MHLSNKLLLVLLLALTSCTAVHRTVTRSSDTLVRIRMVEVPFDTSVKVKGNVLLHSWEVPVINGVPELPEEEVTAGGITAIVSIKDGRLSVQAATKDTSIRITGTARAQTADTTIRTKETITLTKERSWWGEVWATIKDSLLVILLAVAVIIVILFLIRH